MKQKLNIKFMMIAAIAILATAACSLLVFYNILREQIFDDLKANVRLIESSSLKEEKREMDAEDIRITIIDGKEETLGNVIYDSMEEEAGMENHALRPEIKAAIEQGEGRDIRKSVTSSQHTFYYACRMKNGNILRVGKNSASIYHLIRNTLGLSAVIVTLVFVLCIIFSHYVTRNIMMPIEKMADNIVLVDERDVYEEMRPFISTIKKQHADILNHARMRQEFTANVSHELKTPLTAISGYAELIANGMTGQKDTAHFAEEIHKSAERLQMLINDIIKLSELDDEDMPMEMETLDLYSLSKSAVELMQIPAQKNEIAIYLEGEPTPVNGNKTLLEELIYNLCSNAVRYNKRGGKVNIFVGSEQGMPVFMVKDTGIGIPENQQEHVFERFYRVDKSRSKSTGGTGLGLAIVKHIVAHHNAQILLTSEEGVGTEVKVIFNR